jgi:hypothetical protein
VNDWNGVFLAVIAVATATMAVIQVGAFLAIARVSGQVKELVATVQKDIRPLIARATAVADEAHKTALLATQQAQKIDKLVTDLTQRVDETSLVIQQAVITPAREGMALFAAFKAGLAALRGFRDLRGRPGAVDDEDALFIG